MMMMVIVIPSVTEWQLRKAMSFHSLREFFKLLVFLSFLALVGCVRSVNTGFRDDLSVPSSRACLTPEDGTKSRCNLFYVHGLVASD